MKNPRYTNEAGGILLDYLDGDKSLYADAGEIYDAAISGAYGAISPYVAPTIGPAAALAAERSAMVCSRLQGRLVLGEATSAALDAMAADPATPWAMRETINSAIEWRRTSQTMDELGYLLGYTPEQMDDMFRVAMTVAV